MPRHPELTASSWHYHARLCCAGPDGFITRLPAPPFVPGDMFLTGAPSSAASPASRRTSDVAIRRPANSRTRRLLLTLAG